MSKKKVMVVYGTRPEALKVAPLIHAIERHPSLVALPVSTGQHREILEEVNTLMGIEPVHNLRVGSVGKSLNWMAGDMIQGIDQILAEHLPEAVVVQGDTTTVLMAGLAAFNRQIPLVHLEAGLRSHNLLSPFPEEANRRLTTQITALHLAPTVDAALNLRKENVNPDDIVVTGNTVIDALHTTVNRPVVWTNPQLEKVISSGRRIITVTTHRRENWGKPMENIGAAIAQLARRYPDVYFVLPLHPNPYIREIVIPCVESEPNVLVLDPLDYGQFSHLMQASHVMVSDSGGVQEEAPSLGVPVLVLRENTERPEGVAAGTARLIGTDSDRIVQEVSALLDSVDAHKQMASAINPYGDGFAADRAVGAIAQLLGVGERIEDFSPSRGGDGGKS